MLPNWTWLRQAISDENGVVDVAYISLFLTGASVMGSIAFICLMATVSFGSCLYFAMAEERALCHFDPLPIGQAVGLICGGFATALGALGLYMAATRKKREDAIAEAKKRGILS